MSKKYKKAMDNIILSDELRNKILEEAVSSKTQKKPRNFYIKRSIAYAACFLLCAIAIGTAGEYLSRDTVPEDTVTVSATSVPTTAATAAPKPAITDNTSLSVEKKKADSSLMYEAEALKPAKTAKSAFVPFADNNADNGGEITAGGFGIEAKSLSERLLAGKEESGSDVAAKYSGAGNSAADTDGLVTTDSAAACKDEYAEEAAVMDDAAPTAVAGGGSIKPQSEYAFKTPQYIPEGYALSSANNPSQGFVDITYTNTDNKIIYNAGNAGSDTGGDYESVETVIIGGKTVTMKQNSGLCYLALWSDNGISYSLSFANGLDKETAMRIIKSVD